MQTARQHRGRDSFLAGMAAEDSVARDYQRRGHPEAARRWRGRAGEIDLVFRDGETVIFVEVKKARDFETARTRLGARQIGRIYGAVAEFVESEPRGQLTDVRFDLALVDQMGRIEILENCLA